MSIMSNTNSNTLIVLLLH